jgi:hypothetical protein
VTIDVTVIQVIWEAPQAFADAMSDLASKQS